ncbi:DNA-dependent RNA polymerase subunit epsilon [Peribacillus sp. SCS-155]|uniref:DNA-dependent RNA polymerase subunit epsilon n=1 Tax=Peribacillus sedimenti TaxID=3115297 RepID=UPI003905C86D
MIFKVYYQEDASQVPVRENTKTIYVAANTEREVRLAIKDRNFNVEYVQKVSEDYLVYEKEHNEDFNVLEIG